MGEKMPKAVIEYTLPEELNEYMMANKALNMYCILWDIDQHLREKIKYEDKEEYQPELLYSGQGATVDATGGGRIKLNYVTLPVLAKFPVVKGLSLEAGPQVGFLVNSKFKTNTSNDSIDGIKTLDFSVAAGLEYELKNGVIFQGRCTLGLSNVGGTLVPENDRAFNSAIQFSVGYLF